MRMDSSHLKAAQADSPGGAVRVVLVTQSSAHAFWLASALGDEAEVVPVVLDMVQLESHLSESGLGVVMVDFSAPATEVAALLAADLRSGWPGVVLMGAGSAADSASMLAALRCGVTEFVYWDASESEARTALGTHGARYFAKYSSCARGGDGGAIQCGSASAGRTCGHGCDNAGRTPGRHAAGNAGP